MIEPTESESKSELDRFVSALIQIRQEIKLVAEGAYSVEDNPVINSPHTSASVTSENWDHPYTREVAAYPLSWVKERKFWPSVSRIDSAYGDRNLMCSCAPVSEYTED